MKKQLEQLQSSTSQADIQAQMEIEKLLKEKEDLSKLVVSRDAVIQVSSSDNRNIQLLLLLLNLNVMRI